MIVVLKINVSTNILSIPLQDILELLVYLIYVMEDNNMKMICGILSDNKPWQCFNVKLNNNRKLEIVDYIHHFSEDEISHLGFLPSLAENLHLD